MSNASTPPQDFVFVEGLQPAHYERKVRSYVSRKVWKNKRLEQVRKYQTSSPSPPLTPTDQRQALTTLNDGLSEAQLRLWRSRHPEGQQIPANPQLLLLGSTARAIDNARARRTHHSLLMATERDLIHTDPFRTLPLKLDRSGQDLAYRAKNLFLQSTPNWAARTFTETMGMQIAYTYEANFCSMLAAASNYLDSFSGREPSLDTLRWTAATTSCVRRTLSNPATQDGDEALLGVFLLMATDLLVDGGMNSHLHSKILARLFRLRGGLDSLRLPYTIELFISFLLITPFGRAQTSYLDHISTDAEAITELQEWQADVNFLVLELRKLNIWATRTDRVNRDERNALLAQVFDFVADPTDMIEQDQKSFIVCFLAVMTREYKDRPEQCDRLLRNLVSRCKQLSKDCNLADVAWLLASPCANSTLKWTVIRMLKVLLRLSTNLRSKLVEFMYGLVDPQHALDVLEVKDFEDVQREAFARLPLLDSTWRISWTTDCAIEEI